MPCVHSQSSRSARIPAAAVYLLHGCSRTQQRQAVVAAAAGRQDEHDGDVTGSATAVTPPWYWRSLGHARALTPSPASMRIARVDISGAASVFDSSAS